MGAQIFLCDPHMMPLDLRQKARTQECEGAPPGGAPLALRPEKWIITDPEKGAVYKGLSRCTYLAQARALPVPALDPGLCLGGVSQRAGLALRTIPTICCVDYLLLPGSISGRRPWWAGSHQGPFGGQCAGQAEFMAPCTLGQAGGRWV